MNLYTQAEKVGMSKVKCKIVIFLEREQGLTKWITIFNIFIYGGIWSHIHLEITFNRSAWRRKMCFLKVYPKMYIYTSRNKILSMVIPILMCD